MTKRCLKCGELKDVGEFQKRACNKRDGLHTWCKPCVKAYQKLVYHEGRYAAYSKKAYEKNREERIQYAREYYRKNRERCKAKARDAHWQNKEQRNADSTRWYLAHKNEPEYKAKRSAIMRRWLKNGGRNTPEYAARQMVRNAVKCGVLQKKSCEVCGNPTSQAHHHKGYDLANWLNVKWLCHRHHCEAHARESHP